MNGISRTMTSAALVVISTTLLPSCKKPADAAKADLREAGYQLTEADWFRASRGNDVEAMRKFVAGKFSTDTRNAAGDSALHEAAASGALDSADYLLDLGMAVDLPGGSGRTPLMAAVITDQSEMVCWLLRQGADPRLKDAEGFRPLMLAVREGSRRAVGELAAYDREDLDPALLLAALIGQAEVIDALTNYGASVYARMEDGRTPLMIAAENGHEQAVKLLLEIGSSRYTRDPEGRNAADMASGAGYPEIAALIVRDPIPGELALESPEEIAESMDAFVDAAIVKSEATGDSDEADAVAFTHHDYTAPSVPIEGERLSKPVAGGETRAVASHFQLPVSARGGAGTGIPPLVMRHYREREVPIDIETVQNGTATLRIAGASPKQIKVRAGDPVPDSNLVVVRVERRMEDSKVNPGGETEISVVELRDTSTGATREWIAGVPSSAHDPVALVEDAATGKRYIASPGQRFMAAGGSEFLISDVRPNQLVIEELATGEMRTIPLRGPRG